MNKESEIYESEKSKLENIDLPPEMIGSGVDVDGKSFDVGIPEMYYRTFVEYRN